MSAETQRMPALFVGHGSPMNAIERNEFHSSWRQLGRQLPRPTAILCISAHWAAPGVRVTSAEQPETIHDFFGFSDELFAVTYPAKGDPGLARRVVDLLSGHEAALDTVRGLDHGAWSVLIAMYPDADVPVVQLSLDTGRPASFHYALGRQLAPLRDEGVLILGSGNLVHNLRRFSYHNPQALDWAVEFNELVKGKVVAHDHEGLVDYCSLGAHAPLAIPTPEHYLPLLYVLAVQSEADRVEFVNDVVLSAISMTAVLLSEGSPT